MSAACKLAKGDISSRQSLFVAFARGRQSFACRSISERAWWRETYEARRVITGVVGPSFVVSMSR